jgi:hypothetical protein
MALEEHCIKCKKKRTEDNKNEFEHTSLRQLLSSIPDSLEHEYLYCKAGYGCFHFLPKKDS